jgi:hypothetical protein
MSKVEFDGKILIAIGVLLILSLLLSYGSSYFGLAAIVPLLIVIGLVLVEAFPRTSELVPYERSKKTKYFRAGQISRLTFSSENAALGSIFSRNEISSILKESLRNKKANDKRSQKFEALPQGHRSAPSQDNVPKELEEILSNGRNRQRSNRAIFWLRSFVIRKDRNYLRKLEKALDYIGANSK